MTSHVGFHTERTYLITQSIKTTHTDMDSVETTNQVARVLFNV